MLPKVQLNLHEVNLGSIDGECLQKIVHAFPNITTLDITEDRVDNNLFRIICSTLTKLRVLRIRSSSNQNESLFNLTDVGITGIPEDECSKLVSHSDDGGLKLNDTKQNVESLRIHPNIRNLKGI
jgi:hypothetical protein